MAKQVQLLSKRDRFQYLVDHTDSVLRLRFPVHSYSSQFSRIKFNWRGQYSRPLYGLNEELLIRRQNGVYLVEVKVIFNFNRELRNYYQEFLGMTRMKSTFQWGTNVIPSEMRLELQRRNIPIPKVRRQGYRMFFAHLNNVREAMIQCLDQITGIKCRAKGIQWSLGATEIDYDILTAPERQLADEEVIIRKFNESVDSLDKDCRFKDNGKTSTIPCKPITQTWGAAGDKAPRMLVGYNETDKCKKKMYWKESGPHAAINRAEDRYEGYECFRLHFGGNTIKSEADFVRKIGKLAAKTFAAHYEILNEQSHLNDRQKRRLLKSACRIHGGYKYWFEIYETIKKKQSIHTGANGAAMGGVARKVLELHRQGKIFRKKKSTGRGGVYVVDWDWVLNQHRRK